MIKLKIDSLEIEQDDIIDYLASTNQLKGLVQEWILRKEIDIIELDKETKEKALQDYLMNSNLDINKLESRLLNQKININSFKEKLTRPYKIVKFREEKWGTRAKTLYLKNKNDYDMVTYHYLEFYGQSTMQEIYYRLKDRDETWQSMAAQLNRGIEDPSSIRGPIKVSEVDEQLLKLMRHEGIGKVTIPIKIGNTYAIAELINIDGEGYSEETRQKILRAEFEKYIISRTNHYFEKLELTKEES